MWARFQRFQRVIPRRCLVLVPLRFGFRASSASYRSFSSSKMAAASAASSASSVYFPDPYDHHHLLDKAKLTCADLVIAALPSAFPSANLAVLTAARSDLASRMAKPSQKGRGEIALPCFIFNKKFDPAFTLPPPAVGPLLAQHITSQLTSTAGSGSAVEKVEAAGPYVNFYLSSSYLASVVPVILDKSFLAPLPLVKQQRIMIEYSQPNTHKAFHVGHTRNASLGDCLVRLYEQMGHPVVAANYFGDEGAHVAKCLWYLNRYLAQHTDFQLDSVPETERGEWLGQFYTDAVEQLDLATLTSYPYPYVVPAKVVSISPHPAEKAPKNWHLVRLQVDESGTEEEVVCGGMGYNVGDKVAYMPVGAKVKGVVVAGKDMMGVTSRGIMMSERELGIETKAEEKKEETAAADEKKDGKGGKGGKQAKPAKEQVSDAASQRIHTFPASLLLGVPVAESGRLPTAPEGSVMTEWETRKAEVRKTLLGMEHGDEQLVSLWMKTRQWSLDEFKRIYAWLNVRFDHDFFESEVSEESRLMANDFLQRGVFIDSNGAKGADLTAYGLGFCMVLKSDGSGLYATKDLALAKRKFEQFGIDQSIYIVDAAQSLHFKQVFKTLELMGYEQAKQCVHIAYGQVVLESGKMSSRAGNVILFSQLRRELNRIIYDKYLVRKTEDGQKAQAEEDQRTMDEAKAEGKAPAYIPQRRDELWTRDEIELAQHAIAVAAIKYGMLNHDIVKDVVFKMDNWTSTTGNTGPYMLYAYARIRSIIRKVAATHPPSSTTPDLSLLSHDSERAVLTLLHDYWTIIEQCTLSHNPSALCTYLFDLSKGFTEWYDKCAVLQEKDDKVRDARLAFIEAIAMVIQQGLGLLGINTLDRM